MVTNNQALDTRFNSFIERKTPWAFFTGLGDYIRYALAMPVFKTVIRKQFDIYRSHLERINDAESQTLFEMRTAKDELLKIIKAKNINAKLFEKGFSSIPSVPGHEEDIIEQLEKFEAGKIQVGGFHSDYLNMFLFDIAANLLKLGYAYDLKKFIVTDKEYSNYFARINGPQSGVVFGRNTRGNFIFSKTWPIRFEATRVMESAREIEAWGAFIAILKFHIAQQEAAKDSGVEWVLQNCVSDPDFPFDGKDAVDVYHIVNDIKTVLKNHGTSDIGLKSLHINDLRIRVTTVHFQLMQTAMSDDGLTQIKRRAMTEALHKKRDEAWKGSVDSFMRRVEAFMDEFQQEKDARAETKQVGIGGHWWKSGSKPVYDKENRKIILDGKECEIPKTAYNKQVLCEYLFPPKRAFGEPLNEYEVINLFYKRGKKISPRAFYDTINAVNELIEKKLKVADMLKYQANPCQVRVRKELFP
jgi:hypothetical protein